MLLMSTLLQGRTRLDCRNGFSEGTQTDLLAIDGTNSLKEFENHLI